MNTRKICIVGGGSSGWMTAAAFAKRFPHYKIQLIEHPFKKPLSVGESTLGHFNRYLDCLGIDDRDWMPECNATYKLSIQFTNWKGQGDVFQYPFGDTDYTDGDFLMWYYLHHLMPDIFPDTTFCEFYNPISYLAQTNTIVDRDDYIRNFKRRWDTSYHFDATKFGGWLRDNICQNVEHTYAEIVDCKRDLNKLTAIVDKQGDQYEADYFIDCTGFNSLLLGKFLGTPFYEFSDLPNNSAVAAHVPYKDKREEMKNYTDGKALKYGWLWTIPLWDSIGKGFVYSDKFCNKEYAESLFREETGWYGEVDHIKFPHGKRHLGWVQNVIGIGLSYGFLEPLESTGLFTTHENILRLVDAFERRDGHITQVDVDGFNHAVSYELEAMKEFVALHYTLSPRNDSDYWRFYTENSPVSYEQMFDKIVRSPRMYQEVLHCFNISNAPKDLGGLIYIAAGLGYHPLSPTDVQYKIARGEISIAEAQHARDRYLKYKKSVLKYLKEQPVHYDYLKNNIYV